MKNFFDNLQVKMISDDAFHFVWGFFFCSIVAVSAPWWAVIIFGFVLGLAKEVLDDKVRRSHFSVRDMIFTIIGAVSAALLKLI